MQMEFTLYSITILWFILIFNLPVSAQLVKCPVKQAINTTTICNQECYSEADCINGSTCCSNGCGTECLGILNIRIFYKALFKQP